VLLRQRDARANPRMSQKISPDRQRQFERGQKLDVALGQRSAECFGRCRVPLAAHQRADIDPIGMQGFQTTEATPITRGRRVAEKALKQQLVIPLERDEAGSKGIAQKPFDDTARIWTAIDVIADSHGKRIVSRTGG